MQKPLGRLLYSVLSGQITVSGFIWKAQVHKLANSCRKIIALHKHWCTADSIKQRVGAAVSELTRQSEKAQLSTQLLALGQLHSQFLALSVWYALLYVVVEGYRDLGLHDTAIDRLLAQSDHVDMLRRFRNATFHYQENPLSEKLFGFLEAEQSEDWIRQLNSAFSSFFERELPIKEMIRGL